MGVWLEALVPWGTETVVWIQSFTIGWLETFAIIFTYLGNELFYLILLPLVYWCVDKGLGARLAYISLMTAWVNSLLKFLFVIPRPSDPRIRTPLPETSPSFPSGHAQNAVVNWGYLAYQLRSRAFWVVAIIAIIGIGLSRFVLGVHFPQDVIAGWIFGLIMLLAFIWAEPKVSRWLAKQSTVVQLALAAGVPLFLIFLHPADTDGHYPAEGSIITMATLLGLGVGLIMERKVVGFRVEGIWWLRGIRFVVGLVVVALFYAGPKLILPEEMAYGWEAGLRIVRYTLVGWAVAFLAPWVFVRIRLAGAGTVPPQEIEG